MRTYLRARTQRGAATIEFALIMTLLLTVVFGILSYGYMLSFRQGISQGAAEGARAAAVAAMSTHRVPDAVDAVNDALTSYGVECTGVPAGNGGTGQLTKGGEDVGDCTVVAATCSGHDCINVSLDYLYKDNALVPTIPGMGILLPSNLTYTASARVS